MGCCPERYPDGEAFRDVVQGDRQHEQRGPFEPGRDALGILDRSLEVEVRSQEVRQAEKNRPEREADRGRQPSRGGQVYGHLDRR